MNFSLLDFLLSFIYGVIYPRGFRYNQQITLESFHPMIAHYYGVIIPVALEFTGWEELRSPRGTWAKKNAINTR